MLKVKGDSPFDCEKCTEADKENRNCFNLHKNLSEAAVCVTEYTDEVKEELKEKDANKVFSLGNVRFYICPLSYFSEDTKDIMRLIYLIDDTKQLLFEGGWGNQLYWLVEAYELHKQEVMRSMPEVKK